MVEYVNFNEIPKKYHGIINKLILDAEDLECIKMWLDNEKVPSKVDEKDLSIIGRIMVFKSKN